MGGRTHKAIASRKGRAAYGIALPPRATMDDKTRAIIQSFGGRAFTHAEVINRYMEAYATNRTPSVWKVAQVIKEIGGYSRTEESVGRSYSGRIKVALFQKIEAPPILPAIASEVEAD
jgi:hypothetical protein